jgi:hypothetical protein
MAACWVDARGMQKVVSREDCSAACSVGKRGGWRVGETADWTGDSQVGRMVDLMGSELDTPTENPVAQSWRKDHKKGRNLDSRWAFLIEGYMSDCCSDQLWALQMKKAPH